VADLRELRAALDRAQSAQGPFILEIDMLKIGGFKTAFAGPPTKLAQPA
jgi:acetolactate synthase-1/2/3 large subunit